MYVCSIWLFSRGVLAIDSRISVLENVRRTYHVLKAEYIYLYII